jgi:hypothetical protein
MASKGNSFTMPNASQGESRSHGFFYRADSADGSDGILGLPIAREVPPGFHRLFGSAASMLFLRREQRTFQMAGELESRFNTAIEDNCVASCTDWYGNARPIFAGNRVFALLGYELVEGRMGRGAIREIGRVNYAPPPERRRGRG